MLTSIVGGADFTSLGGFFIVLSTFSLNVTVTLSECISVENGTSLGTNVASKAFDIFVYVTSE